MKRHGVVRESVRVKGDGEKAYEIWSRTGTYLTDSSVSGRFQSYSNLKLTKYIPSLFIELSQLDEDCNKYKGVSVYIVSVL